MYVRNTSNKLYNFIPTKHTPNERYTGKFAKQTNEIIKEKVGSIHKNLIDRVKEDRDWIEREIRHESRNARRHVRANPEKGIGIAPIAGAGIGILLGRLTKQKIEMAINKDHLQTNYERLDALRGYL